MEETSDSAACSCDSPHCPACHPDGVIRLSASRRTRRRFLVGFAGGTLANLFLPVLLPFSVLFVLIQAIRYHISLAPRMLAGALALGLFWIVVLPRAGSSLPWTEMIICAVFLLVIFLFLGRPGRLAAKELMFKGRGLLGGYTMAATLVASVLSAAALIALPFAENL